MNPNQLFTSGGTPTIFWVCGICGRGFDSQEGASRCCCCDVCGKPIDKKRDYSHRHRACQLERDKNRYKDRIEKAEKLESWDGPVFNDVGGSGDERDYYANIDDMIEAIEDEEGELPEYVFVCDTVPLQLDFDRIIDDLVTDTFDDAEDQLSGLVELRNAVKAFNDKNTDVCCWRIDYSRAVKIKTKET